MKNSSEAIDKLLAGMRGTEVPAGMQQRILTALETRAAALHHRPRLLPLRPSVIRWAGASACTLALLALLLRSARAPFITSLSSASASTPSPTLPISESFDNGRASFIAPLPEAMSGPIPSHARRPAHLTSESLQFSGLANLPSQLAPPLPLTDQEKLLLQVARRGQPEPVPTLNPDTLATQEAEHEASLRQLIAQAEIIPIPQYKD